jgi:HlyD family secretion protein
MNRKAIVFTGLALALVGFPLLSKYTGGDSAKEVEVELAATQVVQSSILASGTLAYREQVQLRAEVIAKVKELNVAEADQVSKGDLIIRLDPEQFQAQVEQQEAAERLQQIAIERQVIQIDNLERSFRRKSDLFKKDLIDEDSYEAAENQLALARVDLRSRQEQLSQAKAALAQSREQLAKTEIRTPIDGIVIQVDIKVGETVIAGTTNIPGSTLVVVADPSEMLAEVQVDEADIAQVRSGTRADIFAAAFPDTALAGVVESIATVAKRQAGQQGLSFLVKIVLANPEEEPVRPGMSARTDIYTESSENALAVPVQAILYDEETEGEDRDEDQPQSEEQPYVMLIEDGKAVRRDVQLGISSDEAQEITEGLSEGDPVITGPYRVLRHLDDGDPVKQSEDSSDEEAEAE